MAGELVLYTHPMSRGRIARWMLEEVGQPYRTKIVEYGTTMKAPAYLAINPMGKVPTLTHGTAVVTECAAICAYLADTFADAGLAPAPQSPDRADLYRWLFFAAGPLEAATTNAAMGFAVPAEKSGMVGYGSLESVTDALDGWLATHDYIAGGRFSAADVYVASHLGWGMMFGTIKKRPVFERYHQRLAERPAARAARDIDDALMAKYPMPRSR